MLAYKIIRYNKTKQIFLAFKMDSQLADYASIQISYKIFNKILRPCAPLYIQSIKRSKVDSQAAKTQ